MPGGASRPFDDTEQKITIPQILRKSGFASQLFIWGPMLKMNGSGQIVYMKCSLVDDLDHLITLR